MIQILPIFFLLGCSLSVPITWEDRVVHRKVEPLSLAYSEYGQRGNPTLLLLHGFGENQYTWRFIVPYLVQNYHLITIDLKGFGSSPKSRDDYYSVYDQAFLVNQFIQEQNLEDITLIGRSFGGGIALVFALLQEDKLIKKRVNRMILMNTMAYKQNLPSMLRDLKTPVLGYWGIYLLSNHYMAEEAYKYAFYRDDLISKESIDLASNYLSFPMAKYAYLKTVNQLVPDDIEAVEKRFNEIKIPTLILWGKKDVAIHLEKAYRLHKAIKGSSLKLFSEAGHMPQEEIPQLVSQEIIHFLEEN